MVKLGLLSTSALGSTAIGSAIIAFSMAIGAPAHAQAAQSNCTPTSPNYDKNTGNCTQPAEGTPGQTAPGSNPATTPSDEEPTQEELDPNAGEEEAIVVTGSRIPRPQFEGTIPGAQVTAEQIQTRSFTSALEALNDIPLVGTGASAQGTNGGQPGSLGAAFVDLLDLGTNRTLTLVNGRRFVSGNQGTLFVQGNTTGLQVDLSVIPSSLISRFDVLTVGGAAAYGSDAVAGVVNAILVDDYDGQQVTGIIGINEEGDGFNYKGTGIVGRNFMGDRANITLSYERSFDASLTGDRREFLVRNFLAPTFFGNGGVRNPAFTGQVGGPGAFLSAGADQVAQFQAQGTTGFSVLVSDGGTVLRAPASQATQGPFSTVSGTTVPTGTTGARTSVANNSQLVPGTTVNPTLAGCSVTNLTTFCNFSPTGLPGAAGAQQNTFANAVVAQFAPTQSAGTTQAQRNALAVQLLQANRPTPREFFAANPQIDPTLFIGQFVTFSNATTVPAFFTAPSGNAVLPGRAQLLNFNPAGNLVSDSLCLQPGTTGSTGAVPCSQNGQNPSFFNVLQTEQTRDIGNLFAHFDITDNITVYTEALYARINTVQPATGVASANTITTGTGENAVLIFNLNNPFLDANDRAALVAAGVAPITATNPNGGQFLLSRTNQDLAPNGDSRTFAKGETMRVVGGLKGDFGLFGRNQNWDMSATYGESTGSYTRLGLLDAEYAMALDAVVNPANGQIVCRAQIDPVTALNGTRRIPQGVNAVDIVTVEGANGVREQKLVVRQVTDAQIAACVPFNPFGVGQSSEAARDYVTGTNQFDNTNTQLFLQASLAGTLLELPGGPLGYALSGDYRKETIEFLVDDELSGTGRTRFALLPETEGEIENYEGGLEVRIPIFGENYNLPLFRNLEFTPGIRFVRQSGRAPSVLQLNGTTQEFETGGKWNQIYSIAGSWRPVRDVTFRGNYTRSLRQPSIVELFLGGQPAFNAYTDPCTSTNFQAGQVPTLREQNCIAGVLAAGVVLNQGTPGATPVTTQAQALQFLQTFSNPGGSITGTFFGSPSLEPERGESYTFGVAANPSFIPGLRLSADYINVILRNQIRSTTLTTSAQLCYDSPTFPDTGPQVGVNTCTNFQRGGADTPTGQFTILNGFRNGYLNLGALQVEAINVTAAYNVPIDRWFSGNAGKLELFVNAYHLLHYRQASNGNLKDKVNTFDFAGSASAPSWEVQGRVNYQHPSGFYGQWTTNWTSRSCAIGISDICATNEEIDFLFVPAYALHNATIGWRFGESQRFGFQLTVNNVMNKQFAVPVEQAVTQGAGGYLDALGRRYRITTSLRF